MENRHRLSVVMIVALGMASSSLTSAFAQNTPTPLVTNENANWLTYGADLQRTSAVNVQLDAIPNLLWRYSSDITPKEFFTTPLVSGPAGQRRIYFAADRFLVCIDGETGAQLWRSKELQRPVGSPITLVAGDSGDMLLAITSSGQLNALRVSDGGLIWQAPAIAPVQNVAPVLFKTPKGPRILVALTTGRLLAYALDGQIDADWEVSLGSFSASPTATPAFSVDGQYLYIPTQDQRLYVVNIAKARIEFPIVLDTASFVTPVVAGDYLIAVVGNTLQCMKQRTGQTLWRFNVKSTLSNISAKVAADGTGKVFIGARNGKFFALNASNGAPVWQVDLADSVTSMPVVTKSMILIGTNSGMLFGLAPDNGKVLWRYRLNTQREVARRVRDDDFDNGGNNNNNNDNTNFGGDNNAIGGPIAGDMKSDPTGTPTNARTMLRTFGVSSMPAVVDDAVYVLGDNAALYAFGTKPFDADPPQVINPQLSIPNSAGKPSLQRLDAEKPLLVPGRAPIQLSVELNDIGCGVDPNSIQVSLNNQVLPPTAIAPLVDATGRLLITLAASNNRSVSSLQDGLFTVAITANDFRGNQLNWTGNFLVDNTVPPPKAPVVAPVTDDNNNANNNNNGNY